MRRIQPLLVLFLWLSTCTATSFGQVFVQRFRGPVVPGMPWQTSSGGDWIGDLVGVVAGIFAVCLALYLCGLILYGLWRIVVSLGRRFVSLFAGFGRHHS